MRALRSSTSRIYGAMWRTTPTEIRPANRKYRRSPVEASPATRPPRYDVSAKLDGQAQPLAAGPRASREHVANLERFTDIAGQVGAVLELQRRQARDDEELWQA